MSSFKLKDNVKDNINKMKKNKNKNNHVKFNFRNAENEVLSKAKASQHKQNDFIKPAINNKPVFEKRNLITKQYLDNRIKYWIDSRLSMVINSNSLLSRGVNSIKIEPDYSQGGESFMFVVNGEVVAKITDRGFIYCRNLLINGYDLAQVLNSIYNEQDGFKKNYVTHQELEDGTYELNVKDIITKFLKVLISTLTANQTMNGLIFGKDNTINGNNAHLCFTYAGDDNVNNSISLGFKGYTDQYTFYRDRCKFLAPFVTDSLYVPAISCQNTTHGGYANIAQFMCPNMTTNNGAVIKIGKSDTKGNCVNLRYQWAGSNNVNNYFSIGHHSYDDIYRFYRDKVEFFEKLRMRANINIPIEIYSNKDTPAICLGYDSSTNNSISFRYRHNTTPHSLGIGFYGNEDILTIDTNKNVYVNDGMFGVICSAAHKIYQKLEYNSTLDNNEYIRFQINDDTKQAMIDFVKTSEGYKLMLYIFMSLAGITITESSIELLGQINVSSDLAIRSNLQVDHIYSNNQLYIDVNNSFRLFSDFWLDNHSISQICISSDYANNQKIGDNALITSQAVKNAIAAIPTPQNLFDKIDEGEWTHTLPDEGYYCWALYYPSRSAYIIFRKDSALMYESPDGEHNWMSVALPALVNNNNVACLCVENTMFYYNGLQLYKYTDENTGWVSASVTLTIDNPTMACLNDFLIIAGGDSNTTQSVARYNRNNSNWTVFAFERGARRFVASGSDRVVTIEMNTSSTQKTIRWSFNGYNWDSISISHVQHTSCFAYGSSYNGIGCWVAGTHSGGGKCTCIWWDSPLANAPSYAAFDKPAAGEVESIVYNEGVWLMYISGDANYYFNRSALPCYGTWEHADADNSHVDTRAFWCKDKFILLEDSNFTDEYNVTYIDPIYKLNTTATITAKNISVDNEVRLSRLEAQMSNIMTATLQTIYPVGAIYTSMNPRSPEFLFGFGTWTQIVNKFLYCSNSSGTTGGYDTHTHSLSKSGYAKIATYTDGTIPATMTYHGTVPMNHNYWARGSSGGGGPPGSGYNYWATDLGGNTDSASSMPPYMTVYAWQRTA